MNRRRGYTLMEMVMVVAIIGAVMAVAIPFIAKMIPLFSRSRVRQQIQTESSVCVETITQRLRNGKAGSLVISTPDGGVMVPNSRADFHLQSPLASGATSYAIYLNGGTVYGQEFGSAAASPRALASNVSSLMFTGNANDPGLVRVTLRIDAPWDSTGDPTHMSTVILTNQQVHMVESQ